VRLGFDELPISFEHAEQAGRLPMVHTDPFDRMMIAQAQHEHLTIVTADPAFAGYEVDVRWVEKG
jgi:PIN domain nuclease of toxin-antitoxin system